MVGAHATLHGRTPPTQGCSAPRPLGACGACADGGAARRDAVGIPALMVWSIHPSVLDQRACTSMGLHATGAALQRDPMWRGVGRLHGCDRRLAFQTCGFDHFQALDSTESTSARQVRKSKPGFGLVAKPAHPVWTPLRGGGASDRRKKSSRKPARAFATTIGKGLLSGPRDLFVEMNTDRINRPRRSARHACLPQRDRIVATRPDPTQACYISEAWTAQVAVPHTMPCPGLARGHATPEVSYGS